MLKIITNIEIGMRLKSARETKSLTQGDIAKELGMNKSTIQRYEAGLVEKIKLPVVEALGRFLSVNPAWIIGKSEDRFESLSYIAPPAISKEEMGLIADYNRLNKTGKAKASERVRELAEIPRYIGSNADVHFSNKSSNLISIDFYELPASAGRGIYLSDEIKSTIQVQSTYASRRADFALSISGNSMEPDFSDGDIVFVESMPTIDVGDIGIFVVNGDAFIKKLGENRLISLNLTYDPIMFFEGDSICCMGKVLGKV